MASAETMQVIERQRERNAFSAWIRKQPGFRRCRGTGTQNAGGLRLQFHNGCCPINVCGYVVRRGRRVPEDVILAEFRASLDA